MLFSSVTFVYYFLPVVIALYFIVPRRFKNVVLLVASLFFYFWGEPIYLFLMIGSIISGYVHGILIERFRGTKWSKVALISSIVVSLALLGVFKYSDFFIDTVNSLFGSNLTLLRLALPVGISFYTFQIISYTVDLYRGEISAQRNILKLATYIALFPQLTAGPIVRYATVEKDLDHRKFSLSGVADGITRFTIGIGKKILLANTIGQLVEVFKTSSEQNVLFFWLYAIGFPLQLYYDFSGYSDMAIGLGRIFGFNFPENFNYPYISKSISEFWRRWHMTLGQWFRDYVYIPLGGSRVSTLKWVRNVFIIWALTGLWHGAGWVFALWGLIFAVVLLLEKLVYGKALSKAPAPIAHFYTMLIFILSLIILDSFTLSDAMMRIGGLFGIGGYSLYGDISLYYLRSYAVLIIIGIIGSTPLPKRLIERIKSVPSGNKAIKWVTPLFVIVILILVTAYLVDGSFNPFIYFRF